MTNPRAWRCNDIARATAAYVARQRTALGTEAIAHSLGYGGPSSVSMTRRRVETDAQGGQLSRTLEQIGKKATLLTIEDVTPFSAGMPIPSGIATA